MFSSAQLITMATQIAKCPGLTQQAGLTLNLILSDLALAYDLDVLKKSVPGGITTGISTISYTLPNDYLRMIELFYYISGEPFFLSQMPQQEYDMLFQGPGVSNFPRWWASDLGETGIPPGQPGYTPQLYLWPPPNAVLNMTCRYRSLPLDIVTPETSQQVPWFPDQRFLLRRLCADLAAFAGDNRAVQWDVEAKDMLLKYTPLADDKSGYAQQVKLDPRAFRLGGTQRSTKQLPL